MSVNPTGGGLAFDATIDGSQFQAQINRMEREINRVTSNVKQQGNEIESWAKKASIAAGSYFSLQASTDFIRSMVQVRGEFQQIEVAYRTMLKSKSLSDQLMAESVELAAQTPFGLQQVAQGSKQLLAYGFAAKDITSTLEMLGNVASGVGAPLNDIVYLYGTLRTQGRAYQKDIMQFTQRGIDITSELAKQYNVTKEKVQELVSAGKVGFPQVETAFKNLTGAGGMFNDLMKEQSKTLTGLISNLGDAVDVMFNDLGKANEGLLNDGLKGAIELVENYQKILDIIGVLIVAYGAYRTALILEASLKQIVAARTVGMTAAEMLHYNALVLQTTAQKALNAVMAASPTIAFTAAITALTLAIYALTQANNTAKEAQEGVINISIEATKKLETESAKIEEYIKIAKDKNNSHEDQAKAIKKLNDINPEFLGGLNAQNILTKEGKTLIDDYLLALEKKAIGELAYAEKQKNLQKIIELQSTKGSSIGTFERVGKSLSNFLSGNFTTNADDDLKLIVDQQIESIRKANEQIDKLYAKELKDFQLNGAEIEPTKTGKSIRSETFLEEEIKKLKEQRAELDIHSKAYKDYTNKINALQEELSKAQGKVSKEAKKANDDKLRALEEINKAEQEVFRKGLTRNEEQKQALKDKYDELRKKAKDAGLGAGSLARIDKLEKQATGDLRYQQETEKLQAELEKQKALFSAYEEYRSQIGTDAANKRFENEKAEFDNYGEYLKSQLSFAMSQGLAGGFTGPVQARIVEISKLLEDFNKSEKQKNDERFISAIQATQEFEDKKLAIEKKYQELSNGLLKLPADEYVKRLKVLEKAKRDETIALEKETVKQLDVYKFLFEEVDNLATEELKKRLEQARIKAEADLASGKISIEVYKEILALINKTNNAVTQRDVQGLKDVSNAFAEIAQAAGGASTTIGSVLSTIGQISGQVGRIKELGENFKNAKNSSDKFSAGAELASAGISGIISLTGMFINSAKARRQAEQEFYNSMIKSQNEYNLSLNDEIRLKSILNENVFVKDFRGRIKDGTEALTDANNKFLKSLQDLEKGRAKVGKRNAVDVNNILKGAGSGAAIGAAVGSVVPVIGTAVGAVVGAIGGAIAGLFGGKKKKDVFRGLLTEYPELIQKATDGTTKFNDALAKNLIANNIVDDKTKVMLQNTIDLAAKRKEALEQINAVISDLAGNLGDDLRSSLVQAFKDGEDSAKAFGDTVSKVLENIISQFLFQAVFEEQFDKLQEEMKKSFDIGGDQSFVDDIVSFYETAGPAIDLFNSGLQAAKDEAKKAGLDIFQGNKSDSKASGLKGAIQREMTEQTASELTGIYRASYDVLKQQLNEFISISLTGKESLKIAMQSITHLQAIEINTASTVIKLEEAVNELKVINTNTKPVSSRGLGIGP